MSDKDDDKFEGQPGGEGGGKSWWQDAMREITLTGLATFFMTEDSVRNYLREKKFPKELVSLFLDGMNRKKEDFYGLLAKEFGRVLGKIDISKEIERFLERHKIHLEAKVSFERKHKENLPTVKEKEDHEQK